MKNNKLNKEQLTAVAHINGPLLIVAGAGTGKTTVLIGRMEYLVNKKSIASDQILLLTFTEKAAGEMEDRALKALPYGCYDLWINTFHKFCERILRDHALDIGLDYGFKLLSQTDQWIFIKKNINKFNLNYYRPLGNPDKFIYELIKHFSKLKDENISSKEYLEYTNGLKENQDNMLSNAKNTDAETQEIERLQETADAYYIYNQLLLDNGFLDFGDLICYVIKLFNKRPNILKYYQQKFKFIMVDEFQDTNWAQYELLKILANSHRNLLVVGDDDQAIYKFRGASISNIMKFKDDYPDTKEVILNKNYRSKKEILNIAYNFIQNNNPNRLEVKLKINKKLIANFEDKGIVDYKNFNNEQQEISFVIDKIINIYNKNQDTKWYDFAILTRSNNAATSFTQELNRKKVPNIFVSMRGLYYKPIILDCIAYFKLLDNYHESSALYRVMNMKIFQVPYADIININKFARKKVWSLFEALEHIGAITNISEEGRKNINKLISLIRKHSILARDQKSSKIYAQFIWDSGLNKLDYDKHQEYYSLLNQFYLKIKQFEQNNESALLKDFIELINMEMDAGETGSLKLDFIDEDTVKIMTIHSAKGLEFDYVFLPGLVDKRFPTINRKDKINIPDAMVREKLPETKDAHLEEERRLFYVAITRAKKELYLSSAKDCGGLREKKASIFIEEALGVNVPDDINNSNKIKDYELIKDITAMQKTRILEKIKYPLPLRFSFSQIQAYTNCPLQYKFNFILRIPVLPKSQFIFGRLMHNVLKEFLLPNATGIQPNLFGDNKIKKLSFNNLSEIYKKNWRDDGYESKEDCEKWKKKGMEIIKFFYNDLEKNGWPSIVFLEKNFSLKIKEYYFRGAIDRIDKLSDNTMEIIDYKTGSAKDKIDYKAKRQLILYKIAVEQVFGLKVSKLSFQYLENASKVSFIAKEKDEDKLKEEIINTILEIKDSNFNPKPSMLCKYCDFKSICEFAKL